LNPVSPNGDPSPEPDGAQARSPVKFAASPTVTPRNSVRVRSPPV
jgi:hypothetical protein